MRPKALVISLLFLCPLLRAGSDFVPEAETGSHKKLWLASMGAVLGGTALDAATSWGHREENGVLASSNGNFGMRGVALKSISVSALLIPQLVFRKQVHLRKMFIVGNFADAGIYGVTSVHNVRVTSR